MIVAMACALHFQQSFVDFAGFFQLVHGDIGHRDAQIDLRYEIDIDRTSLRLRFAQRQQGLQRFVVARELMQHDRVRQQRCSGIVGTACGLIENGKCFVIQAESAIRIAHRAQQFGTCGGLIEQLLAYALAAGGQQFARGDALALGGNRIGEGEQVGHEIQRSARLAGFGACLLGLMQGDAQTGNEGQHGDGGQRTGKRMPLQKPHAAIAQIAAPCRHRLMFEMTLHIVGERSHRCVALLGFLAQGLQYDGVEIAAQLRRQSGRIEAAVGGQRYRCIIGFSSGARWPQWLLGQDRLLVRGRCRCGGAIWPPAGEQFVQQQTERVDIDAGGDGFAAHLLGRCVFGREHA